MKNRLLHTRNYRKKYPLKTKAACAVNHAVRRGKLIKQPCAVCGELKSHAHHEDYLRPLDVRWLCHTCHERVHHGEQHKLETAQRRKAYLQKRHREKYIPHPRHYPNHDIPALRALRDAGFTYAQISLRTGMSRSQIFKIINKPNYK